MCLIDTKNSFVACNIHPVVLFWLRINYFAASFINVLYFVYFLWFRKEAMVWTGIILFGNYSSQPLDSSLGLVDSGLHLVLVLVLASGFELKIGLYWLLIYFVSGVLFDVAYLSPLLPSHSSSIVNTINKHELYTSGSRIHPDTRVNI